MPNTARQRLIARKAPATAAGRNALPNDSFVLSEERVFPITSAADVSAAVHSFGRYRGPTSFETFKRRLIALAKRKGFDGSLPASWKEETATKPGDKYRSLQRPRVYEALRKRGMSKQRAAMISNAQAPGHTVKASPTRIVPGYTGIMVALVPSLETTQRLATLPSVTEPPSTMHLTLCYLGSTDELPLVENKERLVNSLLQWMALHNGALHGAINGIGRFFHTEDDGTNAVYVSPDLAALPALRQSLTEWIEQSGIDYAQDHGFTPHVTVAYIPAEDATPPIRVDFPAVFDRLLLAWGDEQYEVPLVEPTTAPDDQTQYAGETMEDWDDGLGTPVPSPEEVVRARTQFAAALHLPVTYTAPDGTVWTLAGKAPNYGARAGQTIAGALGRGASGQFVRAGSGGASAAAPAKPAKGKKPKAPKQSLVDRAAARAAKRAATAAATAAERTAARDAAYQKLGIAPDGQAALAALRTGDAPDPAAVARAGLEDAGLVQRDSEGKYHLTPSGRATVSAAEHGDAGRAGDTIASARDRLRAQRTRLADREQKKRERAAKQAERAAAAGKTFAVFKDARGAWRWVGLTSNGYEDRDAEYVSVKALTADVARADADGRYGPLRWWHMGDPDPMNPDAPWGPGVDLGWCDFNAMSGPFLVESGTFVSEKVAQAIAPIAEHLGLSPGFFHPRSEPSSGGVFTTIRRFERSLAPRAAVSNRYTSFATTKEQRMIEDTAKLKQFEDMTGLDLNTLIEARVQERMKEAQGDGVRLKTTSPPPPPTVYIGPDGTPGIIADGAFVALKAAAPVAAAVPPKKGVAAPLPPKVAGAPAAMEPSDKAPPLDPAAEAADQEEDAAEGDGGMDEGPVLNAADAAVIADALMAQLGPMLGDMSTKMDMAKKMDDHAKDLKAMFGGMSQKTAGTEATVADHATRLKAAETALADAQKALADLQGDTPAAAQRAFYASTDPSTALPAQIAQVMTGKAGEAMPGGKAAETLNWFHQIMTTGTDGSNPQQPPNI